MLNQKNISRIPYLPFIDGLRALAVLSVLLFHAFPEYIPGGFIGVDIFFVISGFLISSIIFQSLEQYNFSFLEFYSRRIRRIFPALIIVLLGCFLIGWFSLLAGSICSWVNILQEPRPSRITLCSGRKVIISTMILALNHFFTFGH